MFIQKEMTAEEFLVFAEQHPDKRFDFMDGEIVEVSPKPIHGKKQVRFASALLQYLEEHPGIGVAYSEVLHVLNGEKFIPDVCVNVDSDADYLTTPPLFVVEIRSDSQSRESQRRKLRAYIRHGVKMGVLVLPGEAVEVYQPGQNTQVLSVTDTLDGGDALPGFKLPLKDILP
jgi:Uma2 family endonuclease